MERVLIQKQIPCQQGVCWFFSIKKIPINWFSPTPHNTAHELTGHYQRFLPAHVRFNTFALSFTFDLLLLGSLGPLESTGTLSISSSALAQHSVPIPLWLDWSISNQCSQTVCGGRFPPRDEQQPQTLAVIKVGGKNAKSLVRSYWGATAMQLEPATLLSRANKALPPTPVLDLTQFGATQCSMNAEKPSVNCNELMNNNYYSIILKDLNAKLYLPYCRQASTSRQPIKLPERFPGISKNLIAMWSQIPYFDKFNSQIFPIIVSWDEER